MNYNKTIKDFDKKSIAKKARLKIGDVITAINNEPIIDFIDENYFNTLEKLKIDFIRKGKEKSITITKDYDTALGINYLEELYPPDIQCANSCIFCFVHQLPKGMRKSLYIKDDDWRYSVLFGNYVTLTNVDDMELERIIKRNASPLYISVHAVDAEVRSEMMRSKRANKIKKQLKYLASHNIIMHTQVVLCPDINDGNVFSETIEFLYSLYPYVRTLAVVPVGLTKHRDNLPYIKAVDEEKANEIIRMIKSYNKKYMEDNYINFVFASDEFYSKANLPFPMYEGGEHYPQLSNGVGMFSELLNEFNDALKAYKNDIESIDTQKRITMVTGVSAYPKICDMIQEIKSRAKSLDIQVEKIENKHFGDSITVAGLLCGKDIVNQLKNTQSDVIIVPASTLKDGKDVFLDDVDINYLEDHLNAKVLVQDIDGYAMIETVLTGVAKG